jgi:mono/diheme cytochrome c family protein
MTTNRIKILAIIGFAIAVLAVIIFGSPQMTTAASSGYEDPAVVYKTKCAACHTPGATKFYDPAKTDEEHVQAILKGKKGEKPPFMPGFETKGMTEDEAKGLAAYMKSLRPAAN